MGVSVRRKLKKDDCQFENLVYLFDDIEDYINITEQFRDHTNYDGVLDEFPDASQILQLDSHSNAANVIEISDEFSFDASADRLLKEDTKNTQSNVNDVVELSSDNSSLDASAD